MGVYNNLTILYYKRLHFGLKYSLVSTALKPMSSQTSLLLGIKGTNNSQTLLLLGIKGTNNSQTSLFTGYKGNQ